MANLLLQPYEPIAHRYTMQYGQDLYRQKIHANHRKTHLPAVYIRFLPQHHLNIRTMNSCDYSVWLLATKFHNVEFHHTEAIHLLQISQQPKCWPQPCPAGSLIRASKRPKDRFKGIFCFDSCRSIGTPPHTPPFWR